MQFEKLDMEANPKQHVLAVVKFTSKTDSSKKKILALYAYNTEADVRAIVKDLGWFKDITKSEFYKVTDGADSISNLVWDLIHVHDDIKKPYSNGMTVLTVMTDDYDESPHW